MKRFLLIKVGITVIFTSLFCFVPTSTLFAQADDEERTLKSGFDFVDVFQEKAKVKEFEEPTDFVNAVLKVFLAIVAIIAVAAIVWGGFIYITAAGDENKTGRAKSTILFAVIGLLLIGAAAIIVNVVIGIIGAEGS